MNLVPTELNQRLANAVRYSVDSDRFYIRGKAVFWRWVGVGVLLFAIGTAVGTGFYGYAFVTKNQSNFDALSSALTKALEDVQLKATAEGTVQIEPREITLAPGQTISLDSGSRVLLDPSARVRADGEIVIQGPSLSLAQTAPNGSQPPLPNITNFTVFKSVPFDKGVVQTGWMFLTSAQRLPTTQYCYYTEATDTPGRNIMLDIGLNGKLDPPKIKPNSFDLNAAFNKCVWFKGDAP